jgi:hypothetical protein
MRKIYLTIITVMTGLLSFAQNGQLHNGGFENWNTVTLYDDLVDWLTSNNEQWMGVAAINQSTDAQIGTYSCEISAETAGPMNDTIFGYVLHGTVGQMGPDGGIPYTDNFDEVRFQYKSDIPVGDTLYLLTMRFVLGNQIDMYLTPAAWGTNGSWTQGSVAVPAGTQDELFIGFVMGDPFNGPSPTPGSWARIDNVQMWNLGNQMTDVPDPSFENWTSMSTEVPDYWYTLNEVLAGSGMENAIKTIDANSGSFAIEMTTIQDPNQGDTIPGMMSITPIDIFSGNPFMPGPYQAQPTTFSGAYKYTGANGDQGGIQIQFMQAGVPVGTHFETFNDAGTWTTFSSPLTISGQPDSIIFTAYSGNNPGSVLKLDDLSFSGGDVGLEEFATMNVNIFPNPATDHVMIKADGKYSYEIVDLTGKTVRSDENINGVQNVSLEHLRTGAYVVRLTSGSIVETYKLIVK